MRGNYLTKNFIEPTYSSANGIWSLDEQFNYHSSSLFPKGNMAQLSYLGYSEIVNNLIGNGDRTYNFTSPSSINTGDTIVILTCNKSSSGNWCNVNGSTLNGSATTEQITTQENTSFVDSTSGLSLGVYTSNNVSGTSLTFVESILCSDVYRSIAYFYRLVGNVSIADTVNSGWNTSTQSISASIDVPLGKNCIAIGHTSYTSTGNDFTNQTSDEVRITETFTRTVVTSFSNAGIGYNLELTENAINDPLGFLAISL